MRRIQAAARAVQTRGAVIVGVFVVVALAAGATSVLAGGSPGRPVVPRSPATPGATAAPTRAGSVIVGRSYRNTRSRPLRLIPAKPPGSAPEREANPNPSPVARHQDAPDTVRQTKTFAPNMPTPALSFDGIAFPGFNCNCSPPDQNGEIGATQYVQVVNQGFQVFDKTTGASLYGPADIATLWSGFGGVCESNGFGDPVVVYDQLADRWLVSQFAGASVPTDECIAVSTGPSATGAWSRYAFHFGSDFFDYPKLGIWPDAYYMTMNVFNSAGTAYRGPQPFAFDRAAMLAGQPATFVTTRAPAIFSAANDPLLPADLDGTTPPPAGAPEPFLMSGTSSSWKLWRFHVDFVAPASSTFTLGGTLAPAPYSLLCPNATCVPQLGTSDPLDALGDRAMYRLAYRNFGDHEALVGNQSVSVGGVGGTRWYELNHVSSGSPAFTQQSTYAPADGTWRWLGSAAMDGAGDLALGFSASSSTIHPQIRYAGRLAADPPNTLAQGEAHLFDGGGSQTDPGQHFRWGDYSDLTVDPVNDCTFWYTNEYYAATASNSWRTRIADFSFPSCGFSSGAHLAIDASAEAPSVLAGSHINFDVTLRNRGPDAATGISATTCPQVAASTGRSTRRAATRAGRSPVHRRTRPWSRPPHWPATRAHTCIWSVARTAARAATTSRPRASPAPAAAATAPPPRRLSPASR